MPNPGNSDRIKYLQDRIKQLELNQLARNAPTDANSASPDQLEAEKQALINARFELARLLNE